MWSRRCGAAPASCQSHGEPCRHGDPDGGSGPDTDQPQTVSAGKRARHTRLRTDCCAKKINSHSGSTSVVPVPLEATRRAPPRSLTPRRPPGQSRRGLAERGLKLPRPCRPGPQAARHTSGPNLDQQTQAWHKPGWARHTRPRTKTTSNSASGSPSAARVLQGSIRIAPRAPLQQQARARTLAHPAATAPDAAAGMGWRGPREGGLAMADGPVTAKCNKRRGLDWSPEAG